MSAEATAAAKAALRRLMRSRRAAIAPALREAASLAVRDKLAALLPRLSLAPRAVVAAYWPIKDELDPRPAMSMLRERGFVLALPVAATPGMPLAFRAWSPEMPLSVDRMGIPAPPETASEVDPALLLVPMLAFDAAGRRLGYGAGFYDRTLAELRSAGPVLAVGLAFAAQEVDSVPAGPDDSALDAVVTEGDVLWFRRD
jgi:5-formyltetrahydrofolate cyclo-ligase